MYNKIKKSTGFTLIELLVVIAIISLLSSIILASLNQSRAKARDAIRMSDMHEMNTAILLYKADHNDTVPYFIANSGGANGSAEWTQLETALSPYISKLPLDPCGAGCPGAPNNGSANGGRPSNPGWFSYAYVGGIGNSFENLHYAVCTSPTPNDPTNEMCQEGPESSYILFAESLERNFSERFFGHGNRVNSQ